MIVISHDSAGWEIINRLKFMWESRRSIIVDFLVNWGLRYMHDSMRIRMESN
jgi:hypothetical protein